MSKVTGVANTLSDLFNAFVTAAAVSGWTATGSGQNRTLSKGGLSVDLSWVSTGSTNNVQISNGTQNAITFASGYKLYDTSVVTQQSFDWPVSYEAYSFTGPDEVLLVVKYGVDHFQHIAFGNSPSPGINDTLWMSGSTYATAPEFGSGGTLVEISNNFDSYTNTWYYRGGMFANSGAFFNEVENLWLSSTISNSRIANRNLGAHPIASLLYALPSSFSSATALLPINLNAITGDVAINRMCGHIENIRLCRIDNVDVEQVISYGAESWKIYPFLKKNAAIRNPNREAHSGTMGYAVRQ